MPYADVCTDGTRVLCAAPGEPPQVTFGSDPPIPCPDAGLYVSAEWVPSLNDHIAVAAGWQTGMLWVSRKQRKAEIRQPSPCGSNPVLVLSDGRILSSTCNELEGSQGYASFDYPADQVVYMDWILHHPPVHDGLAFNRAYRHLDWEIGQHPTISIYLAWNYAAPTGVLVVGPSFDSPVQPKIRQMADGTAVAAMSPGGLFSNSPTWTPWASWQPPPVIVIPDPPPIIVVPPQPEPEPEPPPVVIVVPPPDPEPEPPKPPRRPWWRVLLDYWFGGI